MYRHKVNAFFCVRPYYLKKILRSYLDKLLFEIAYCVIHGNSADHSGRSLDKRRTEIVSLAVVAEIHNSLCAVLYSHIDLFHLGFVVFAVARYTEVYVYLRPESHTDPLGRDRLMIDIAGNTNLALCNRFTQLLCVHVLFLRYDLHLRSDYSLFCGFHLCFVISHFNYSFQVRYFRRSLQTRPADQMRGS